MGRLMGDLRSRGRDQGSRTPKDQCRKDVPGGAKGTSALVGMVYSLKCVNSAVFFKTQCHRRQAQQGSPVIPDAKDEKYSIA